MIEPTDLPTLNAIEARALGCLIEKQATTPDAYPLTVNATHVAANQKTARDPVMAVDVGEINHALRQLESKGLAKQVFSSRAERYEHRMTQAFGLVQQQTILLGLLLLRGPQTVSELLARSQRQARFEDANAVRHQVDRLCQRQPPLIERAGRGPGQREERYAHLLCGPVDITSLAQDDSRADGPPQSLEARIVVLEEQVAALKNQIATLLDQ
jgi:uncharacterized protein YceH (UPF0502 family)